MKATWKWLIGILVALFLLASGTAWYLSVRWKPILDQQLKEAVLSSTDSLYRIEYEDLSLNLLRGSAKLKNLKLISDSLVYAELEKRMEAPDNVVDAEVELLRINGLNIRKAVLGHSLDIKDVLVHAPRVTLKNKHQAYNDTLSTDLVEKESGFRLGSLEKIQVGRIGVLDINFTFDKEKDSVRNAYHFQGVNLIMEDVLIDSTSFQDSDRFFYTGNMVMSMGAYELEIPESMYKVGFDSLSIRTDRRQLVIEGLQYAPKVSRTEFYEAWGVAKDMIEMEYGKLIFTDLDLKRFSSSQRIHAAALYIEEGNIHVSNDRRYPRRSVNKIGQSPHQQLMKLDHPIKIDTVFVDHTRIAYSEISAKYLREGEITFERTSGWLANVTNDSLALTQDQIATADLTTYVMNQGQLHALFTFDMLDDRGAFTYSGTLGPMNGKAFNRILTPLLSAEIGSAGIRGLRFEMQGHDHRNWGNLWFDYEDMKVNLMEMDEDGNFSRKKLVSFLANELLINDSNPSKNGKYIVGRIDYQRPHDFSFFKTLWKSLLEGIKQTAGISAEREARLTSTAQSAQVIKEKSESVFQSLFRRRDRSSSDQDDK